jgi:hypothetical protein
VKPRPVMPARSMPPPVAPAPPAEGLPKSVFLDVAFLLCWSHSRSENMAASDALRLWDVWQARKAAGK